MKKTYLLFTVLWISLLTFGGNITKTYYFDHPVILTENGYQRVTFDQTLQPGLTGEPVLPYRDVRLLLPPGEEAVNARIIFEDEVCLEGIFLLCPQQESRPLSEGSSEVFKFNEDIYQSRSAYPMDQMGHYSTHFMNGHSVFMTAFTPVSYIPANGQVRYYRKATIEVTTAKTGRAHDNLRNLGSGQALRSLRDFVENEDIMQEYPAPAARETGYQILVITPEQFSEEFEEYRMLYLIRGMKTEIATVEEIGTTIEGDDLQEKIRNFIIQEYQENGVEFVLLGGDVEHIPYRGFYSYVVSGWGYEEYNIPADLYYSALDGNWNDNGDNKWGEPGEDDLLPDVSVARWPFSTLTQLERLLHKTALYQDDPVTGELQRPLMAGENLWSDPLTWGGDYLDLLIGHHDDNGYVTDGIPETDDIAKIYDRDGSWNSYTLIDEVNTGRNFIHHSGHANETYVMRLGISDITNQNFSQVDGVNHNYTLVYTHGCLCGAFDQNDCIGEAMVLIDHFAVAGAFNSRYGWFNEGQTEGPSQHLHREFVDALYDQKENRIGYTHLLSKVNTSPWVNAPGQWEEGALRWCFYACNILGDPALGVWTREPIPIDVQYPDEIVQGATSFMVSVTSQGEPAEGLMCVMMSGDEMIGCSATDATGQAIISMPEGFSGEEAELVVSGYHCQPRHYPVNVQVGIPETNPVAGLSAYPVPFNEQLTLSIFSADAFKATVIFRMTDGRRVHQEVLNGNSGVNTFIFNTGEWPQGVILLQFSTSETNHIFKIIHLEK